MLDDVLRNPVSPFTLLELPPTRFLPEHRVVLMGPSCGVSFCMPLAVYRAGIAFGINLLAEADRLDRERVVPFKPLVTRRKK